MFKKDTNTLELVVEKKKKTIKKKKHKGCTEPLHKVKSKGVVKIIPANEKCSLYKLVKNVQKLKNKLIFI